MAEQQRNRRSWRWGVAALVVLGGAFLFYRGKDPAPLKPAESLRPVRPVKTMELMPPVNALERSYPGKVQSSHRVELAFRVSGPLVELPVKRAQGVHQGELLARIDSRDYVSQLANAESALANAQAQLAAMKSGARKEDVAASAASVSSAKAHLAEAEAQYRRFEKLHQQGAVADAEFDRYKANYEVAKAQYNAAGQELSKARTGARPEDVKAMEATIAGLAAKVSQARSALEDTELRAPFDGFIADRHVENFQSVQRDQPIVNLQDLAHLEVTIAVPEQDLLLFMGVSRDMVARAFSEATGSKEIPLAFKEIATQADPQTQTYAATLQIVSREGLNLLPGMTLSVRVGGRAPGAELSGPFRVPSEAVMAGEGSRHSVWIVQENLSVRRVAVALLSFREGDALISGDLKPGDRVVTAGANLLSDGETVSLYVPK